jgi:hypothetical protein
VVSFTPRPLYPQGKSPWYPLDRRLGGPQSRSGRGGEEKNSQPPPGIEPYNPDRPARSPALYRLSCDGSLLNCNRDKNNNNKNNNNNNNNNKHPFNLLFHKIQGPCLISLRVRENKILFTNIITGEPEVGIKNMTQLYLYIYMPKM